MSESVAHLVTRLRPKIESLLAAHRVEPAEAEILLTDLLQTLCFKRSSIADPGAWLLASLLRAIAGKEGAGQAAGTRPATPHPPSA